MKNNEMEDSLPARWAVTQIPTTTRRNIFKPDGNFFGLCVALVFYFG
jgi:hypothetical protein